jgi:hypothetical protein
MVETMVLTVNTSTIPKYHKPLDWASINDIVYLFACVRKGAGVHSLMVYDLTIILCSSVIKIVISQKQKVNRKNNYYYLCFPRK